MTPLVVCYGMGVDSTAMLIEMRRRDIVPDLVIFADTGGEKPDTYAYAPTIGKWLERAGFPPITTVHLESQDESLEAECIRLGTVPALAFGFKTCSLKWKVRPQERFFKQWAPALEAWSNGERVTTAIGFDAGPKDRCRSYAADKEASIRYERWFPLIEWGFDRERCKAVIREAGLPEPPKSACFFCPATKRHEVDALAERYPHLLGRALTLEAQAAPKLRSTKGLSRGYSWREHLLTQDHR